MAMCLVADRRQSGIVNVEKQSDIVTILWVVKRCTGYVRRVTHDEIADAVG